VNDDTDTPTLPTDALAEETVVQIKETLVGLKTIAETTGIPTPKILDADMALKLIAFYESKLKAQSLRVHSIAKKLSHRERILRLTPAEREQRRDQNKLQEIEDLLTDFSNSSKVD
jgi:hypothetical protein